ncbi:MAG: sel1 repeat family protein [Solobacterium sp.]|nr:sel1 repeat family protein [Solobacterium sp.]
MMFKIDLTYTVKSVVADLKLLLKEDIPEEYKDWARDGIAYADRNPEADVLDFPNNIFSYIRKDPMPPVVRELVEDILLQGINQGSGVAACNLGALYYTGQIGEQSYSKAMELYEIAADSGDIQAIENLGYCYYYGRDCEVDYAKAFECFSKGAFQGRVTSLYKIGDMYKNGFHVSQNLNEAFQIYSHCIDIINHEDDAKEYDADVYVRYADCYANGIGCEQDPLTALYWAQRAEYKFRVRESKNDPFARHGVDWAVDLINKCRYLMDGDILKSQPC